MIPVSAVTGEGLPELKRALLRVDASRERVAAVQPL